MPGERIDAARRRRCIEVTVVIVLVAMRRKPASAAVWISSLRRWQAVVFVPLPRRRMLL
jgi:hypothetical protein